jgi:DNA-binding MarR family transcriptional regulator
LKLALANWWTLSRRYFNPSGQKCVGGGAPTFLFHSFERCAIQSRAETTLSSLAEHLGLRLPSVSKLVDGLVKQELVIRQESASDRRCLALALTPAGESIVNSARAGAQASLAKTLNSLSPNELATIQRSLELLHPLFLPQGRRLTTKE